MSHRDILSLVLRKSLLKRPAIVTVESWFDRVLSDYKCGKKRCE